MPVVPEKSVAKVEFYESHLTPWTDHAVAIGTTPEVIADLSAKTEAARAAFLAQQAALNDARAATLAFHMAVEAMSSAGSDVIKQIRAKVGSSGNSVYSLAQISAPAQPSPLGPPGKPTDFTVKLNADGSLKLKWQCPNPEGSSGTMYQIWRRVGDAPLAYLGTSGTKDFTDNTLPAGSAAVMYQIQAVRSTKAGDWAQFNVNFGVDNASGNGATVAFIPKGAPAKMAA
jgi:hypothetical protein